LDAEFEPGQPVPYYKVRSHHRELDSYERLAAKAVDPRSAHQITVAEDLFPGFYIVENTRRFYPEAFQDVCPLLLGRVGLPGSETLAPLLKHRRRLEALSLVEDKTEMEMIEVERLRVKIREIDVLENEEVGRLGLEAFLEPVLRGKRGFLLKERDPTTREGTLLEEVPPIRGKDVVLTLDGPLQQACEGLLDDKGYAGAVVIMEVKTGAIVALATAPRPTRQQLAKRYGSLLEDESGPLLQRAVYNRYPPPPGSVFKLVTAVAGLEEGRCTPEDLFQCDHYFQVGRQPLRCLGSHGSLNLETALVESCNIYFYQLAEHLGYDLIFHWAERFGFGRRTGYLSRKLYGMEGEFHGFPEAPCSLNHDESGRANLMRLAIGQGAIDDVTPLQVARMVAGIATGSLPQPHIIAKIGDDPFVPPLPVDLGIASETLAMVRLAMKKVVTQGTAAPDPAWNRDLTPFKVAGKTGTPEVGGGRPSHACFAGYLPWDGPKWSFAVFIESCEGGGGKIAAPLLNRILETPEAAFLMNEEIE
jgi:penicillin-binding protein 2